MGRRAEAYQLPDKRGPEAQPTNEVESTTISDEALAKGLMKAMEVGLVAKDEKPKRRSPSQEKKSLAERIVEDDVELKAYQEGKAEEINTAPELRTEKERAALRKALEKVTAAATDLREGNELAPEDREKLRNELRQGIVRLTTRRKKVSAPFKKTVQPGESTSEEVPMAEDGEEAPVAEPVQESAPEVEIKEDAIPYEEAYVYKNLGEATPEAEIEAQIRSIFSTPEKLEEWKAVRDLGAKRFLKLDNVSGAQNNLQTYLREIALESGLEPESQFIPLVGKNESVERFLVRATYKIFEDKNPRS
ncbi:MAG: hypothetical protein KBD16_00140 [Candidatus Pacebacteria bacterium]|nr:hypothetical protein [Candidatus Paceibacterota bacterium]